MFKTPTSTSQSQPRLKKRPIRSGITLPERVFLGVRQALALGINAIARPSSGGMIDQKKGRRSKYSDAKYYLLMFKSSLSL
jgi:hypothetical protein